MTDRRLIISELELVLKKSRVIHTLGVEEMAIRILPLNVELGA